MKNMKTVHRQTFAESLASSFFVCVFCFIFFRYSSVKLFNKARKKMLRLLKNTNILKNSGRILANSLPSSSVAASANFASMPEPKVNPEILYTGVSKVFILIRKNKIKQKENYYEITIHKMFLVLFVYHGSSQTPKLLLYLSGIENSLHF